MPSRPDPKAIESILLGGEAVYTREQAIELAGADPELAGRVWRALGFPTLGDDSVVFAESDVEALRIAGSLLEGGVLDEEGVVFDHYRNAPDDLPRVETSPDAGRDALREAAGVVAALPREISTKVDHVEVATVDQISLVLRDERVVLWGSAEESELKAEVLVPLLSRPGQTYDITVPGQATVRP